MIYADNPVVKQIIATLGENHKFTILTHMFPDGDSIGSQLGLAEVLKTAGKEVSLYLSDAVPDELRFLALAKDVKRGPLQIDPDSVVIIVDTAQIERISWDEREPLLNDAKCVINIDHHISNTNYGTLNWVDPHASCVGEMLYYLCRIGNLTIDRNAAIAFYVSILTDTGGFRYTNTSAETFEAAADLVRLGADPTDIANKIYSNMPVSKYRLLQLSLQTLHLNSGGAIATMKVTRNMIEQAGAATYDSDGFVGYPTTIKGVQVAALLRELEDSNTIKVSLRSKDKQVDVNRVANVFGGGGHPTASGCIVNGSIDEAEAKIIAEAEKVINKSEV